MGLMLFKNKYKYRERFLSLLSDLFDREIVIYWMVILNIFFSRLQKYVIYIYETLDVDELVGFKKYTVLKITIIYLDNNFC